jgi:hypothetical protein
MALWDAKRDETYLDTALENLAKAKEYVLSDGQYEESYRRLKMEKDALVEERRRAAEEQKRKEEEFLLLMM